MGDVLLGVANSSYITFSNITGYEYNFTHNVDKKDMRTKGGTLFTYVTATGNFSRFRLPTTFVSSSDVSIINSWFSTATDLRFIESDDFPNSYYTVRITGAVEPFTSFNKPYFRQYYKGSVVIETV
jgi:hypothetical protein|tara:strand:+ start:2435 stop:2812 length:378 start_codon:yes stop_codon:yes gene_type:complete